MHFANGNRISECCIDSTYEGTVIQVSALNSLVVEDNDFRGVG
jgi:hypothetical protein